MSFTRIIFWGLLSLLAVTSDGATLAKRTELLENRQSGRCDRAGWVPICPGPYFCAPPGAVCCQGDTYVDAGETCANGPAQATVTPAPVPPTTIEGTTLETTYTDYYTTYYYTLSWTYIYYYYTYIFEYQTTATYSYETTLYTTFSFTGTNEADASSLYLAYSATVALPTPIQTETLLSGSAGSPPAPTATPTANATISTTNPPPAQFTGGAASAPVGLGVLVGAAVLAMVPAAAVML